MKKWKIFWLLSLCIPGLSAAKTEISLLTELNYKGVGVAVKVRPWNHFWISGAMGVSNAFTESKWNDPYGELIGGYQMIEWGHLMIPLQIATGMRYVQNYEDDFIVPYLRANTGLRWSMAQRHHLNLGVGYQYGQKKYLKDYQGQYATVQFLEKYEEWPWYVSIAYEFSIQGWKSL